MARTYTINSTTVTAQKNSLNYSDTLNDRTTCSFVVLDPTFDIDVGMEVTVVEDLVTIFAGTVDSVSEQGYHTNFVSVSCVDFSQLIDKRIIATSYESELAGDIVKDFITTVFTDEGIIAGTIQDGPTISKAVFNYDNGNVAMNYLADVTGFNWEINNLKQLNFFDRSTYTAPVSLTDTSRNYKDLTVKKTRSEYRNRQYVRAGTDITSEIALEKPTPKPDGVSKTFVVRLPIALKPRIFIDSVEVAAADIGVNGLDTGKKYYFSYSSNVITQDDSETTLADAKVLEVTYKGLYPLLVVADDPLQINVRQTVEGGSGIHENIIQESNLDTKAAALGFAQGKLEKYGIIPKTVTFDTYEKGLKAGQLISITNTKHNLSGTFLIDSVAGRADGVLTLYSVQCLDGASVGGWEQLFKTLLQGNRKLVIRGNEVVVRLLTFSDEFKNPVMTDIMTYHLHQYNICGQVVVTGSLLGELIDEAYWEQGAYNTGTGAPITTAVQIRTKNFINVSPNTSYSINFNAGYGARVFYYKADGTFIGYYGSFGSPAIPLTFTTDANTEKIRVVFVFAPPSVPPVGILPAEITNAVTPLLI